MEHPLTIVCTPLPVGSFAELQCWRHAFEAALEPWLDARQLAHVRRFGRPPLGQKPAHDAPPPSDAQQGGTQEVLHAALSRLLVRAQLLTFAAQQAAQDTAPLPQLSMDIQGRPLLSGWHVAFSHSHMAAFCAFCPAPAPNSAYVHALDAESLSASPPHASAFSNTELHAPHSLPQAFFAREALRRWTIKEALLKASGMGLGINPASVPTGRFGQRAGVWRGPMGAFLWRSIPYHGHWLCLAQRLEVKPDIFSPVISADESLINLPWPKMLITNPHTLLHGLLHGLAALRPRG